MEEPLERRIWTLIKPKDETPDYEGFLIAMSALARASISLGSDEYTDYNTKTINHFLNIFLCQRDKPLFERCEADLAPTLARIFLEHVMQFT